jgi:phosphatidylinositol glycan class B
VNRRAWIALAAIVSGALVVRIVIALAFPNEAWPDEIFQTQEQAHRLAFGYGIVPWEFRDGARSWLLPGALAVIFKIAGPLYRQAGVVVLSLLSLIPVWGCYRTVHEKREPTGSVWPAVIAAVAVAAWFELIYFAPKALSEVVAAHLLCGAVYLSGRAASRSARRLVIAGILGALAVGLRIHLAPAILVLSVAVVLSSRRHAQPFLAGLVLTVLAIGMLDWATWGAPFASYLRAIQFNLIEGRAQFWGTAPWWAYLALFATNWSAVGIGVVLLALIGARRDPIPLLLALIVLLTHSGIGHKEYRFATPVLLLTIYSAGLGLGNLAAATHRTWLMAITLALWCGGSLYLARELHTAKTTLSITLLPPAWQFEGGRAGLTALGRLRRVEPLCGVGLIGVPWYLTGGYTWLHRNVPMLEVQNWSVFRSEARAFNAAVAPENIALPAPFEKGDCEAGLCIWQRTGGLGCAPPATDLRAFAPP